MRFHQKQLNQLERLRIKLTHTVNEKGVESYEALRLSRRLDQHIAKCQRSWLDKSKDAARGGGK